MNRNYNQHEQVVICEPHLAYDSLDKFIIILNTPGASCVKFVHSYPIFHDRYMQLSSTHFPSQGI